MRDIARSLIGAALALTFAVGPTVAQEPYRTPPQEVVDIVDAPPTPDIAISPDGAFMTVTRQRAYPSIAQLAQPALGLAGIRFNTRTNGDDQPPMGIAIDLIRIADGQRWTIELPDDVQLSDPFWSPDGQTFAFTNTTDLGVQLWVASVDSKRARRLTDPELMAALGRPCQWMSDSDALLCKLIPAPTRNIYVRGTK